MKKTERRKKEEEEEKPIKVEQIPPKKQKVKPLSLTYNFLNVFHNRYYIYSNIFNKTARLVRENRLDEAIEYYKVFWIRSFLTP